ncbi:glycerol-3-phosphate acyltransferase [Chloroflexota bacterium]
MDGIKIVYSVVLPHLAFGLGACPFSVWIGRRFLRKDITRYGDHNPGAANVLRAGGGRKLLIFAVAMDVIKGIPFVIIADILLELPESLVLGVGLCAILGHAYSPFLKFQGGKAVAVTVGVFLVLPRYEPIIGFALLTILGLLLIESHAWAVIFGLIGPTCYFAVTDGATWYTLYMVCVLLVLGMKHYNDLKLVPRPRATIISWFRSHLRD